MIAEARHAPTNAGGEWFSPLRFGLILVVLLFAVFPRVLLGLDSFCYRDYGVLGYPFVFHHREAFWRGEIPLWNPLSNCGAPFLAQWGTMTLYPFSLIYLLLPLPASLTWFCFGHLALGGMGMYWLARRWVGDGFAASVAGTAYVFSGVAFSSLIWPNYQVALGWMPWMVLTGERAWREGGRWIPIAALVAALQMLAGVPEISFFTWGLMGLLWAEALWAGRGERGRLVGRLLLVGVLATGLIAAQVLPFLDLLAHSQRDRNFATSRWAMPGWGWANFFVPLFHCFRSHQGPHFQHGQEFLTSYYLGIGVVVLALVALWRRRERRVWLLGGAGLVALILALGEAGHFYSWLRAMFPPLGVARFPVKFVFVLAFVAPLLAAFAVARWNVAAAAADRRTLVVASVAVLVAIALTLWFQSRYPFPFDFWPAVRGNGLARVLFLVAIVTAVLLLPAWRGRRLALVGQLAVLLLLVADVITHVPEQNPRVAAGRLSPGLWSQAVPLPPPRLGESRVMISPEAEARLLHSDVRDLETDFLGKRLALWSNLNLLEGLPKVNGSSTLQLREQAQVQALLYPGTNSFTNGLIRFLAVSHRTKPGTVVEWAPWTNAMPLVSCGQRPVFADATNTLAGLVSPGFDPAQIVFLPPEAQAVVQITNRTVARVMATRFTAHRVEVDVKAEEPSLLVVAQSFYHPWRAEVSGAPAPLLRANHAFQAVPVPAGEHRVVLSYRDRKFALGAFISAGTLVVCLVGCCLGRRRSVSAPSPLSPGIAAGQVVLQRRRSPARGRETCPARQP